MLQIVLHPALVSSNVAVLLEFRMLHYNQSHSVKSSDRLYSLPWSAEKLFYSGAVKRRKYLSFFFLAALVACMDRLYISIAGWLQKRLHIRILLMWHFQRFSNMFFWASVCYFELSFTLIGLGNLIRRKEFSSEPKGFTTEKNVTSWTVLNIASRTAPS